MRKRADDVRRKSASFAGSRQGRDLAHADGATPKQSVWVSTNAGRTAVGLGEGHFIAHFVVFRRIPYCVGEELHFILSASGEEHPGRFLVMLYLFDSIV